MRRGVADTERYAGTRFIRCEALYPPLADETVAVFDVTVHAERVGDDRVRSRAVDLIPARVDLVRSGVAARRVRRENAGPDLQARGFGPGPLGHDLNERAFAPLGNVENLCDGI